MPIGGADLALHLASILLGVTSIDEPGRGPDGASRPLSPDQRDAAVGDAAAPAAPHRRRETGRPGIVSAMVVVIRPHQLRSR